MFVSCGGSQNENKRETNLVVLRVKVSNNFYQECQWDVSLKYSSTPNCIPQHKTSGS